VVDPPAGGILGPFWSALALSDAEIEQKRGLDAMVYLMWLQ
jgi:hypothetical protein